MRYQLMTQSNDQSEKLTYYYDPLTIPIEQFEPSRKPTAYRLTQVDIRRPDLFVAAIYGSDRYRDFIMIYNRVKLVYDLKPGDVLRLPEKIDIDQFVSRFRK